jgi:putative membrane protein
VTADLPAVNATLNGIAAVLLVCGWVAIRADRRVLHGWLMGAALLTSAAFLVSYLIYHYSHGSTKYEGTGALRAIYLAILISHILLAAGMVIPILLVAARAARRRWPAHRRLARWTLPVWLYVSLTGVIIYFMLHF